jgi:Rrf2 family cysteine metabolism transcriptional repressor
MDTRDWGRAPQMKLSTKGKYGVQALFELAMYQGAGPVSLKTIAERQGLSEHYLEQLAAPLRKAGLIVSIRGAQGGYTLSRPANQISVGDIIRVLEGPIGFTECTSEGEPGLIGADGGAVQSVWAEVTRQIIKVVDAVSLQDLVEQAQEDQARSVMNFQI